MEQTDIPLGAHGAQKTHEGARPLGKLETEQHFVLGKTGTAAHHIAQVRLGHFIAGKIENRKTLLAEPSSKLFGLSARTDLQANEHMRLLGIGNTVVKLGNATV